MSLQDNPVYTALSYVWGDPTITEDILINGFTFAVTKNLAAALRYVKRHWNEWFPGRDTRTFRLWADAVCINQHDIEKRSHQITLMTSIYTNAELVIAWLGDGDEEIPLGLQALHIISREAAAQITAAVSPSPDGTTIKPSLQWIERYPSLWFSHLDNENTTPVGFRGVWKGIERFMKVPYWSRIWVFQEIVLARRVLLAYGPDSISFGDLVETLGSCVVSRI